MVAAPPGRDRTRRPDRLGRRPGAATRLARRPRHHDRAVHDLAAHAREPTLELGGDSPVDPAELDTTVAEVVDGRCSEAARGKAVDGVEDASVVAADGAREDVRAEERLIDVDAHPPNVPLLGRHEGAEPTCTRDVEDDARPGRDLREREAAALG